MAQSKAFSRAMIEVQDGKMPKASSTPYFSSGRGLTVNPAVGQSTVARHLEVQFPVQPIKYMSTQLQALIDEIPTVRIWPRGFYHGEELLRMALVDLGVQLVVDQAVLGHPPPLHNTLADPGRDTCEGLLDDAHAGDTDLDFVHQAGAGEDAVEGAQSRPQVELVELLRFAADAAQEFLERRVVEGGLLKLTVLFDQVSQNVESLGRVRQASDQGGHGAGKKGHREEELLLGATEAVEGHRTVHQGFKIGIVEDVHTVEHFLARAATWGARADAII